MTDAVVSVMPSAGLRRRSTPSGAQEHDLAGGLVDEDGVAVGRRRRRRRPVAGEDRLDLVGRGDRQQLARGSSFHTFIDASSTIERAAVDGVDGHVLAAELHAGRVGHPLDAGVDDGDGAVGAVVDDDDARGLVDVEVGAGSATLTAAVTSPTTRLTWPT